MHFNRPRAKWIFFSILGYSLFTVFVLKQILLCIALSFCVLVLSMPFFFLLHLNSLIKYRCVYILFSFCAKKKKKNNHKLSWMYVLNLNTRTIYYSLFSCGIPRVFCYLHAHYLSPSRSTCFFFFFIAYFKICCLQIGFRIEVPSSTSISSYLFSSCFIFLFIFLFIDWLGLCRRNGMLPLAH